MPLIGLGPAYYVSLFQRVAMGITSPLLVRDFGLDPAAAGLLGAAYFYPALLAQIPAGVMADRWGPRRTVGSMVLLQALGGLLFAAAPGFPALLAGRALVGFGSGGVYVPALKVFAGRFGPRRFATVTGTFIAIGNLGGLTATGPLALLLERLDWRPTFALTALVTAVLAVAAYVFLRERGPTADAVPNPPGGWRQVLAQPEFRKAGAAFLLLAAVGLSFSTLWGGLYLTHGLGLSQVAAGTILLGSGTGVLLGGPLAGWVSDRFLGNRKRAMVLGTTGVALSWTALTLAGQWLSPAGLWSLLFFNGLSLSFVFTVFAFVRELFPERVAGLAFGMFNVTPFLGAALLQPVMGAIVEWVSGGGYSLPGFQAAFGLGIVLLLGAGVLVALIRNAGRRRAPLPALLPLLGLPAAVVVPFNVTTLFVSFLKIGAVLYGSGYVLLALLKGEFVDRLGWLSETQLLDAVAIGQVTPGPVLTTATFVGYVLGGLPGALVATLGIFLPSFVFVALLNPLVPRLRDSTWAGGFLDGVNAGALALMAGVTWQLAREAIVDPLTGVLALVALGLLVRTELNSAWLVLAGGLVGLAAKLVLSWAPVI